MTHWSRTTAIHEAGHAVAWLVMGFPVERVEVFRKHGTKAATGSIGGRCRFPERTASIRQEVTALYAGPVAEARHKRCSLAGCLLESIGDGGDWPQIEKELAGLPNAVRDRAHEECEAAAKAIVRDRWIDILAIANALVRLGHVIDPSLIRGSDDAADHAEPCH
jgi:hypothetical protein